MYVFEFVQPCIYICMNIRALVFCQLIWLSLLRGSCCRRSHWSNCRGFSHFASFDAAFIVASGLATRFLKRIAVVCWTISVPKAFTNSKQAHIFLYLQYIHRSIFVYTYVIMYMLCWVRPYYIVRVLRPRHLIVYARSCLLICWFFGSLVCWCIFSLESSLTFRFAKCAVSPGRQQRVNPSKPNIAKGSWAKPSQTAKIKIH